MTQRNDFGQFLYVQVEQGHFVDEYSQLAVEPSANEESDELDDDDDDDDEVEVDEVEDDDVELQFFAGGSFEVELVVFVVATCDNDDESLVGFV